jgi:simple sugar transport system ATP-binding protein
MAISDRVGVMRGGKLIGTKNTSDVNERMLASMMVGREILFRELEKTGDEGETLVHIDSLEVKDDRGLRAVRGITFDMRAGEILGVAGVEGNGQSELVEALTGLRPVASGNVSVRGKSVRGMDPGGIRKLGLAHIPEDRLLTGISSIADITDNLIVGKHKEKEFAVRGQHLKRKPIREYAEKIFKKFDIRASGVEMKAGSLSGGNMQKLVVAREFSFENTPVLIISQPTRGVDIGAIEFIHRLIIEKRNEGSAILLVSADLDEVMRLSDRILTIYEGRITGMFRADSVGKEELGLYMTGASGRNGEDAV